MSAGHVSNRRLLEIDKHYSLELCFSIEYVEDAGKTPKLSEIRSASR